MAERINQKERIDGLNLGGNAIGVCLVGLFTFGGLFSFFPAPTFLSSVFLLLVYPPILKTGVDLLSRPSFFNFFFPLSHEYQFLNSRFVIRWKRLFNVSSGVRIWARLSPCVCVLGRCYRSGSVFASRSSFFVLFLSLLHL